MAGSAVRQRSAPHVAAVARAVAPDKYWRLRHLVSEAQTAADRVMYAQEQARQARAAVDAALTDLRLDPAREYQFEDANCRLVPLPRAPQTIMTRVPGGSVSPLSMIADD